MPCSPLHFNHNLLRQGTGTADHLTLLRLFPIQATVKIRESIDSWEEPNKKQQKLEFLHRTKKVEATAKRPLKKDYQIDAWVYPKHFCSLVMCIKQRELVDALSLQEFFRGIATGLRDKSTKKVIRITTFWLLKVINWVLKLMTWRGH